MTVELVIKMAKEMPEEFIKMIIKTSIEKNNNELLRASMVMMFVKLDEKTADSIIKEIKDFRFLEVMNKYKN